LFQRVQNDQELIDRIVRFWGGEQMKVNEFKQALRAFGEATTYPIGRAPAGKLAPHHFEFTSQLIRAAGYSGWVVLIDEVELVARYPLKQRARAYAEVGRWLSGPGFDGIVPVFALTDDFRTAVLEEKGDRLTLGNRIRASGADDARELAAAAEKGMAVIERGGLQLKQPSAETLAQIESRVRGIHGTAYDWTAPQLNSAPKLQSARIRQLLKGWITQWDLTRLDSKVNVEIQVESLEPDYSEDENLADGMEESDSD
jgi:hypothetical protein